MGRGRLTILWHNGTNGEMSFQNNQFFMRLSLFQESHEILAGMTGADFEDPQLVASRLDSLSRKLWRGPRLH